MTTTALINEQVVNRFGKLVLKERLAHAYLFEGPTSSGKTQTALGIAKLLNCEDKTKQENSSFCDACPSCIKINQGSHPDVQVFEAITKEEEDANLVNPKPGEKLDKNKSRAIRISQVRYISAQSQFRAFEADKKIFIVKDADLLTPEASNALLKTLEEPTKGSLLILTTAFLDRIFDTVKSRCHVIHFLSLSNEKLEDYLTKTDDVNHAEAHFLAFFTEGSLGRARHLREENLFKTKDEVIDQFVFSRDNLNFIDALAKDKKRGKEALHVLFTWFRDLALMKSANDEVRLIHRNRLKDLKLIQDKFSSEDLNDILKSIIQTSKLLEDNLNIKMALLLTKERIARLSL